MPWSPQQEEAIYSKGQNLLVAAAAGSGKTSVLVERIIQHLVNGYCKINEILVVTFTKAAAGEMQGRIAKAIEEKLDFQQREEQLVLLNSASISTLHSFCQNILRQYFYHLDLDPRFRLANPQEVELLKYDVLDSCFGKYYAGEGEYLDSFKYFTQLYGSERGDEEMYQLILQLFEFAQAQPFPEQWLDSLPKMYLVKPEESPWLKILGDKLKEDLKETAGELARCKALAEAWGSGKYLDLIASDQEQLCLLQEFIERNWSRFAETYADLKLKRFAKDKEQYIENTELFKNLRTEAWDRIKNWKKRYAIQTLEEIEADNGILYMQAKALVEMTKAFSAEFAKGKREKNIIDFGDLEHFALEILAEEGSSVEDLRPTPVALELQAKFKEVMVDEYQDTNGVQEAILNLVAGGEPKKFYVGDVKQSIYKFRLAEPELFLAKYKTYPQGEDSKRIDLAQNFRSRKEVLAGVNSIFSQLMDPEEMELDYGEAEALKYGLDYPAGENTLAGPIELHLLGEDFPYVYIGEEEKNYTGYDGEIKFIVQRIRELYKAQPQVYDKDLKGYRPLAWRDIVILLRSVVGKATVLADELRKAGIPVYASEDGGYFQAVEVELMLSLLQIIDNPQQDIPLTGVLFSVIGGFSQEELGEIKAHCPTLSMYYALEHIAEQGGPAEAKVKDFLERLNSWREYSNFHSVPELLWQLYEDTGYYEYLGGLPEGAVRQGNLRALYTRAKDFEATSYRGLFRFLRYIGKLQALGNDLSVARTLGEGEDVVRIMTIHKSKGLEFPVVFLPNLNKQFNLRKDAVLLHKHLGLGMYLQGEDVAYETLARQAIGIAMVAEAKAEEARVLYVAMTRAREKLIMSGAGLKTEEMGKLITKGYGSKTLLLPKQIISGGDSFMKWILPAVSRHGDGGNLRDAFDVATVPEFPVVDDSRWEIFLGGEGSDLGEKQAGEDTEFWRSIQELKPLALDQELDWVGKRLSWVYPRAVEEHIPAKLTVTEIKQKVAQELLPDEGFALQEFKRPKFLQENTPLTNLEYGTMVHRILQHLDLKGDLSPRGIAKQVEDFQQRRILPKDLGAFLPYKKLGQFFNSPLGQRLLGSSQVEREMHFNKLLPATYFYPEAQHVPDIFLQGVVDLLFKEDDGWVLVDYKTDNVGEAEALERYGVQLKIYAIVVQEILRQPVKNCYLYMITNGETYEVKMDNLALDKLCKVQN